MFFVHVKLNKIKKIKILEKKIFFFLFNSRKTVTRNQKKKVPKKF